MSMNRQAVALILSATIALLVFFHCSENNQSSTRHNQVTSGRAVESSPRPGAAAGRTPSRRGFDMQSVEVQSGPNPRGDWTTKDDELLQADPVSPGASTEHAKGYFGPDGVPAGQCGFIEVPSVGHGSRHAPQGSGRKKNRESSPDKPQREASKSNLGRNGGALIETVEDTSHKRKFDTQAVFSNGLNGKIKRAAEYEEEVAKSNAERTVDETPSGTSPATGGTNGVTHSNGTPDGNLVHIRPWPSPLDQDGREYELESCVNKRMVYCNTQGDEEQRQRKKGKALMLYMMHGWDGDDRPAEWSNAIHLWQHGLLPQSEETQLYDGIDYVFFRSNEEVKEIELCSQHKNVRVYWIPNVPCDLCGHHMLLAHLGYKTAFSARLPKYEVWPYKLTILMNSGVRGPLHGQTDSHWLDVLGMAGQSRNEGLYWADALTFRTIGVASISWELKPHAQSYFLSIPLAGLDYYYDRFRLACDSNKVACIVHAEVMTMYPLLDNRPDFKMHAFVQNFTADGPNTRLRRAQFGFNGRNPTYRYTDPCPALFLKFGGGAWQFQPKESRRAVLHISHQMRMLSKRLSDSRARAVVEWLQGERMCRWFRQTGRGIPTSEPLPRAPDTIAHQRNLETHHQQDGYVEPVVVSPKPEEYEAPPSPPPPPPTPAPPGVIQVEVSDGRQLRRANDRDRMNARRRRID